MGEATSEPFIDALRVAQLFGVSKQVIYKWVRVGRIPSYRIGPNVRFKLSEIEAWAEAQRVEPQPTAATG